MSFLQTAQQDIEVERETYQQSRQSLDAMYQDVKKKLHDETQMRLVCSFVSFLCDFYLCQGGCVFASGWIVCWFVFKQEYLEWLRVNLCTSESLGQAMH